MHFPCRMTGVTNAFFSPDDFPPISPVIPCTLDSSTTGTEQSCATLLGTFCIAYSFPYERGPYRIFSQTIFLNFPGSPVIPFTLDSCTTGTEQSCAILLGIFCIAYRFPYERSHYRIFFSQCPKTTSKKHPQNTPKSPENAPKPHQTKTPPRGPHLVLSATALIGCRKLALC